MKLSNLSVVELISLCTGAEKTMDYLRRHIRINNAIQSDRIKDLNRKYDVVRDKYDKILNEINNRIIDIEDE